MQELQAVVRFNSRALAYPDRCSKRSHSPPAQHPQVHQIDKRDAGQCVPALDSRVLG